MAADKEIIKLFPSFVSSAILTKKQKTKQKTKNKKQKKKRKKERKNNKTQASKRTNNKIDPQREGGGGRCWRTV